MKTISAYNLGNATNSNYKKLIKKGWWKTFKKQVLGIA